MTVVINSTVPVTIVSGSGVTLNAQTLPSFTTDDIFNPANPAQTLTQQLAGINTAQLLGTASAVDCTALNTVSLFTVPITLSAYITGIYFQLASISGSGIVPAISVGFTSPNYQDIIDGITNSAMFTTPVSIINVGQIVPVYKFPTLAGNSGADYAVLPSGTAVKAYINSAATYSTYNVNIFVFGFTST